MPDESVHDHQRPQRIGLDEAILCDSKTIPQIAAILDKAVAAERTMLLTRLAADRYDSLPRPHRMVIDYDPVSRTGILGPRPAPSQTGGAAVVTAGTSDIAVGREAIRTLAYYGHEATSVFDVGVAGLWRLLEHVDTLSKFPVVIAVAGMDAALVSVLGGLVPGAVIAVPTSVGYGTAYRGSTALHASLTSCAPGVVVVNVDNGYGAACAALRILRARELNGGAA